MRKGFFSFVIVFIVQMLATIIPFFAVGQNVGIGTNTPTQKLDINGSIRIRQGNPGNGKVLASDASGNASWQLMESLSGQSVGFGSWGDCSMNNISAYNPVADPQAADYSQFGFSVFIAGSFAIVGARHDDAGSTSTNNDVGAASIFEFDGINWIFKQRLTDAAGLQGDLFGTSVCLFGNFAIVGAPGDDVGANVDQGSASVYQYNGTSWVFLQKLTDNTGGPGDNFGFSVWFSGSHVLVGSYLDDIGANNAQGSVVYYKYNGATCVQTQKISDVAGTSNDYFGYSISVSGNRVVIGGFGDDAAKGAAFIFEYNGTSWVLMQRIINPVAPAPNDFFGASVTISGNEVFVGASGDDLSFIDQGVVYYYKYDGTNWVFKARMTDDGAALGDAYGGSVFLSGDYLIVGISVDDVGTSVNQGAAVIYQRVGIGWQRLQYTSDPGGFTGDQFGHSVSIDGTTGRFLIGAPFYTQASGKAIFGKVR